MLPRDTHIIKLTENVSSEGRPFLSWKQFHIQGYIRTLICEPRPLYCTCYDYSRYVLYIVLENPAVPLNAMAAESPLEQHLATVRTAGRLYSWHDTSFIPLPPPGERDKHSFTGYRASEILKGGVQPIFLESRVVPH